MTSLRVGIAQIAPVLLDRGRTLEKVVDQVAAAGRAGCGLVAFGETLVPGYPIWTSRTDGARFDADDQKALHAIYLDQAVTIEAGHLDSVSEAARETGTAVVLGVAERTTTGSGHTIHCTRVMIDADGTVLSTHRKLMPTYEERLSWGIGDGAGLVVHDVGPFRVGALNCWENWMPLARTALYAAGETLHVAIWPGSRRNTSDITRFAAREGRSYVISASSLLRASDIPEGIPSRDRIAPDPNEMIHDGGSCLAGPDGAWIIEPVTDREELLVADLDPDRVRAERQNFDAAGHYGRADVLQLTVDRRRPVTATFVD
jgi:nitrilase